MLVPSSYTPSEMAHIGLNVTNRNKLFTSSTLCIMVCFKVLICCKFWSSMVKSKAAFYGFLWILSVHCHKESLRGTCESTCIHTEIRTYIHTYIHTYRDTYIHTYMTYMRVHTSDLTPYLMCRIMRGFSSTKNWSGVSPKRTTSSMADTKRYACILLGRCSCMYG